MTKAVHDVISILRTAKSIVISANDYNASEIAHILNEMGSSQNVTIKNASSLSTHDLVKLAGETGSPFVTFDLT